MIEQATGGNLSDSVVVGGLLGFVGSLAVFIRWLIQRMLVVADTELERLRADNATLRELMAAKDADLLEASVEGGKADARADRLAAELAGKTAEIERLRSDIRELPTHHDMQRLLDELEWLRSEHQPWDGRDRRNQG